MGKLLDFKLGQDKLKIVNKSEEITELYIYDAIGESFWGDSISAKQFTEMLNKVDPKTKILNVRINSPGGDVFDGISIYNLLQSKKKTMKVNTYVDGLAASIASIIALAGDEIIMGQGALMMIHKPMAGVYGNSDDLDRMINRLDDVEEQLVSIYAKKTGKPRAELRAMLSAETWMDEHQTLENGFSTKISDDEAKIAASSMGAKWFHNAPKPNNTVEKEIKDKLEGFKKDLKGFLARK